MNDTSAPVPDGLLHEGVVAQARAGPDEIAVVAGDGRSLTYGELVRLGTAVAGALRDNGCRPGDIVAVVMDKGWEQVVAVLGTHLGRRGVLAGRHQPDRVPRRAGILADAGVRHVLTQSWLGGAGPVAGRRRVGRRRPGGARADARTRCPPRLVKPTTSAYVIYTSGSTGTAQGRDDRATGARSTRSWT